MTDDSAESCYSSIHNPLRNFFKTRKYVHIHSSQFQGLCSMKSSSEMLQNLPYFWNMKTHIVIFHFMLLYFFPNECPDLCRHRTGHSLGEKIKQHKMKNKKKLRGFSYSKRMANFEAFRWNFSSGTNPEIVRSDVFSSLEVS